MLNCCQCPTAKISDNTLVLSLPNAMTPVVWMIDMADTGTFVMKVETTDNGLFVLQKISSDGKKTEDIAYYASKKKAVKAMSMITKTIGQKTAGIMRLLSVVKNSVLMIASIGFLLFLMMLYFPSVERMILGSPQQVKAPIVQKEQPSTPQVNPNAVGVPMSADDFLKNNTGNTFPF